MAPLRRLREGGQEAVPGHLAQRAARQKGLGFRVKAFRVSGLGFRVFTVEGVGLRVIVFGLRA